MRLETLPLVFGVIVGLVGLCLLFDAWADDGIVATERRKLQRLERDRKGEALLGLGVLTMAATLIGSDTWRYSVIAAIAGAILMLWGFKRNVSYIRGGFRR